MDLCRMCLLRQGTCDSSKLAKDIADNIQDHLDDDVIKVVRKVLQEIKKEGFFSFAECKRGGSRFMYLISDVTDDEDAASKASEVLCKAVSGLDESDYFIPNDK